MNEITRRARAMQKLTINYCLVFFHIRIFFDILLCIKQMLSWLENMHKYVKNEFEGGEKTQILNFVSDDAERNL